MEEKEEMFSKDNKKKKKKWKIVLIVLFLLIVVGGGVFSYFEFFAPKSNKIKTNSKDVKSEYRMSGNGLEKFDLEFLKLENKDENVIYSPLSIKYALAMLKEGASGEDKEQISQVIGDYESKKYNNSKNMSFANAMFIKEDYKNNVKEKYINRLSNKYSADIMFDDFKSPDKVNSWVNEKTLGLINSLFEDVSDYRFLLVNALAIDMDWKERIQSSTADSTTKNPETYIVKYEHEKYSELITPLETDDSYKSLAFNDKAMYAKAVEIGASINNYDIVKELGEDNIRSTITKEYDDYIANGGDCVDATLSTSQFVDNFVKELNSNYHKLNVSTDFMIYNDNDIKAFAKDLKEYDGTTLQYVAIMPKYQDVNNYIKDIDKKGVNKIIDSLKTIENNNFEEGKVTKITGYIPMFNFEKEIELKEDLKKLGIKNVFKKNEANLSDMIKDNETYIDTVKHKANIDFSNDGIKAAAATAGGGMGAVSCGFEHLYDVPIETIDMTFDRPYIFLIRDKNSGEVWFAGKVYQPTEKPCDESAKQSNNCVG